MTLIKTIKKLENSIYYHWIGKLPNEPIIAQQFGWSLFELTRFTRITLESYSAESKRFGNIIKEKNKKFKKEDDNFRVYSNKSDIMVTATIPEFYSLCTIGMWALLEDFLKDSLFLSITNNFVNKETKNENGIKKQKIMKEKLIFLALERSQSLTGLVRTYRELLGIELNKNKNFIQLLKLRESRNTIAHSGVLFGYNSIINKKSKQFSDYLFSIERDAGMEFINVDPIVSKSGKKKMPNSWYSYDPTKAQTSKHLEKVFCEMITDTWTIGKYISDQLFIKKPRFKTRVI